MGFLKAVDGYKSYALVVVLMVLTAVTSGPGGFETVNLETLTSPSAMIQQIGILLIGSFRSAIGKIIK